MDNFSENNINNSNPFGSTDENFEYKIDTDFSPIKSTLPIGEHRLNDYDNNLFSESAYKGVDDEMFQIEYKINKLENKIKSIQSGIISAKTINDITQLNILNAKKSEYELELKNLYSKYNNGSISSKLSGELLNIVSKTPQKTAGYINKLVSFINNNIFSKISTKFNSNLHIKEALINLENINKNVDDLVSMQTPYGEASEKYNQLLQYLNKANTIQYQISQMVNQKR